MRGKGGLSGGTAAAAELGWEEGRCLGSIGGSVCWSLGVCGGEYEIISAGMSWNFTEGPHY